MREVCRGCERPRRGCVCDVLPHPPLLTRKTQIVVLQHPHESRQKLSTLPLLRRCLPHDLHTIASRCLRLGSSPLLDAVQALPPSHRPPVLVLFPGSHALDLQAWRNSSPIHGDCRDDSNSSPLETLSLWCSSSFEKESPRACFETLGFDEKGENPIMPKKLQSSPIHACCNADFNRSQSGETLSPSSLKKKLIPASCEGSGCEKAENPILKKSGCVLVVIDGTWKHAKEMVRASAPFLRPFSLQVCLPFDRVAEGGCIADSELILRKEPYAGCVSTMEAVATCLSILEPHGSDLERRILSVLRSVVRFQASHIRVHKTRLPKKDSTVEKDTE